MSIQPVSRVKIAYSSPAKIQKKPVQFACRLAGGVSAAASLEGDQFLRALIAHTPELARATELKSKESVGVFASASLLGKSQNDGWGAVTFVRQPGTEGTRANRLQQFFREPVSALTDASRNLLRKMTASVSSEGTLDSALVHVRRGTGDAGRDVNNTHPFRFPFEKGSWTFAHNGRWDQALVPSIETRLNQAGNVFQPKGKTDSERAFLYLMQSLQSRYKTVDSQKLGTTRLLQGLAHGLSELNALPASPHYATIPDTNLLVRGALRMGPSHNFILNDGRIFVAYREGQSLFLGIQKDRHGKPVAHAVATMPTPKPGLVWVDIPEKTFVTITQNQNYGKSEACLYPLETLLDGSTMQTFIKRVRHASL